MVYLILCKNKSRESDYIKNFDKIKNKLYRLTKCGPESSPSRECRVRKTVFRQGRGIRVVRVFSGR